MKINNAQKYFLYAIFGGLIHGAIGLTISIAVGFLSFLIVYWATAIIYFVNENAK